MTTYNQEIEEALLEDDEVYQLQQDQAWGVRDYSTAVWVDEIVFQKEKKIEEIEQIFNERMEAFKAKMVQWKDSASKKYTYDIEFFKQHLHAYHLRVLDEETVSKAKKLSKTIKLPNRSLTFTKQQPEILIDGVEVSKAKDNKAFVQFAKDTDPAFIKEEVKWAELKKNLTQKVLDGQTYYTNETGDIANFIQIIERPEKLDWKLNKEV